MKKETLAKIKTIFEQALEFDPSEREEFLTNKCGGDEELRKEVLSLLDAHLNNKDFLEVPNRHKESITDFLKDPFIGKHIGPYLILDQAGVGGMGVVYKGKRDDKEFEQKVAIKILQYTFPSDYLLKRFQRERQTLANWN